MKEVLPRLKQTLVRECKYFKNERDKTPVTWKAVKANLNPDEAALELVSFRPWQNGFNDTPVYAALLLTKDAEYPEFISLFRETELQEIFQKKEGKNELGYINNLYSRQGYGDELYDLIWSKLEPHLEGVKTIYYSSSGLLYRLNLNALPHPEYPYLGDRYYLVRLNSTRKLVRRLPRPEFNSITLIGGIQYDYDTSGKQPDFNWNRGVMKDPYANSESRSLNEKFDFLEGSLTEIRDINKLKDKGINSAILTGSKATESAFKKLSNNSPKVLHISTHGFFFAEKPESRNLAKLIKSPYFKYAENPLFRSGLAFAGCNYAWKYGYNPYEEDGGILTAYEISNLNLANTSLVVLSACETGLGDIKGDEGIFGLQRAFKMAGVDYLIMSLWKVPDKETRILMKNFYEHWINGQSIRRAFRNAQQTMAQDYPPYFWASLVLVGGGKINENDGKTGVFPDEISWIKGVGILLLLLVGLLWVFKRRWLKR